MPYGSAKPRGFSMAKVTFLGQPETERLYKLNRKPANFLSQPRPMVLGGCPTFATPAPAFRGAYVGRKRNFRMPSLHPHVPLLAPKAFRPQFNAWGCGANLNKASETGFNLSVGSKAILLVEAR
jgi:hypothetical protein